MTRPENYQDEAYAIIKKMIITLAIRPGERVTIKSLQAKLSIGATPIREAIIRLRREGLFRVIPQSGTYVSKINLNEVYQARYVRENLEVLVFKEALNKVTDAQLNQLHQNIQLQRVYLQTKDYDQFFDLDEQFHKLFYMIAGKSFVWDWLQLLNAQFNRFRYLRLEISGLNWNEIYNQHQAISSAFESGDEIGLTSDVKEHLHLVDEDVDIVLKKVPGYFE
ncbi:Transcriptional regulator [Lapidilactobacillus concavus DSM 17758]|uniref:Transcriptional regulator n=1 Tax=Lapidilactobacillus concavus DSM 17758 TaxID=1423735 RepID=A0A0R1W309_9LACO|nr:GntR family transcriptional regulator [Lapidilactobacillus concavus]KRM11957.1 Transcriptional regulator [Lapidilactobacillus concavus DSM 17758]GEL14169.1 transcriptional regulator [Lapidilactobacillus concavus]